MALGGFFEGAIRRQWIDASDLAGFVDTDAHIDVDDLAIGS
jgi:hypothetical protein